MPGSDVRVFFPQDPPNHRKQTALFDVDQIIEESRKRRQRGARFDDSSSVPVMNEAASTVSAK